MTTIGPAFVPPQGAIRTLGGSSMQNNPYLQPNSLISNVTTAMKSMKSPQTTPYAPTTPITGAAPQYNNPLNTPTTAGVSNPYLPAMGNAIAQQATQNLTRNILPAIGRQGVAMGGFGDSRQGIAEGIAAGDAAQGVTNALAGLYGQAYGQDRQYDLGRIGQDQSFYTAQRGQDLAQQGQNFNQYLGALNSQIGLGNQMTNIGQQQFMQGFLPYQLYGGLLNQYTGLNNSTQGPSTGGRLGGALGGGLAIAQLLKLFGG